MTEEEKQFNQWFDEYADGVKVFEEADMKQAYLQGRAELEKENAELKERLKEHESIGNAQFWENVWSWKTKAEQLTKAKQFLNSEVDNDSKNKDSNC